MNKTLLSLSVIAAALVATVARAEAVDDPLKALEARIAQLEAANAGAGDAHDLSKLRINGFMSAGFGRADIDDFHYDGNMLGEEWTHAADSIAGLQVTANVNERTEAVMQLVARGETGFDVTAEWAYVGYRPTEHDEIRMGRQRFPFFMISEYLEVGYSYPWAKPPIEVYLSGMPSAYEGVAWKHTMNGGDWAHELQAYWGSTRFATSDGTFTLEDGTGIGVQSSYGDWTFSASYSQAEATFDQAFFNALATLPPGAPVLEPLDSDLAWFAGLGFQYDNGKLLVMAEGTQIKVHGYFPDYESAYATVGYRFGKFMPHLTYAAMSTSDDEERPDNPVISALCAGPGTLCLDAAGTIPFPADTVRRLLDSEQDAATLGVRYDFLPNAALKVDWTHVLDTHNTYGTFSPDDGNVFYGAKPGNNIDVYRVVVDVVF